MITYNVDAYGASARLSSTADYFELLALSGRTITLAEIADFVSGVSRQLVRDLLTDDLLSESDDGELTPGDVDTAAESISMVSDASLDAGRRVLDVLGQRSRILGPLYPFEVTAGEIRKPRRTPNARSPYIILLSMTVAHAYSVRVPSDVTLVFEDTVSRAVGKQLPMTRGLAAARRARRGFSAALSNVCSELGLSMNVSDVVLSRYIHDGGGDTISHLDWRDGRVGRWTFVGQVTCARSDDWEAKALQARPDRWKLLISDYLRPTPFLAVPHHVEDIKMRSLLQDTQTMVLDRLRLAPFLKPVSAEERAIAESVLGEPVAYI